MLWSVMVSEVREGCGKTGDPPAGNVIRDLKDMSYDVRLKKLNFFNLAKRKMRREGSFWYQE